MSTKLSSEEIAKFTPPANAPKLADLAACCHTGACNVYALTRALGNAVGELPTHEAREHPAVKLVLGQLSYLCGESLGPTFEALENYEAWAAQPDHRQKGNEPSFARPRGNAGTIEAH